jgi:hypothetical protein
MYAEQTKVGYSGRGVVATATQACSPETVGDVLNQLFSIAEAVEKGSYVIADAVAGSEPQVGTPDTLDSPALIDRLRRLRSMLNNADSNNARTRRVIGV